MTRPLAQLKVLNSTTDAQSFPLTEEGLTIGSNTEVAARLNEPDVLPEHAEVLWDGKRFLIRPLGDAKIVIDQLEIYAPHSYELESGASIRIGETLLKFIGVASLGTDLNPNVEIDAAVNSASGNADALPKTIMGPEIAPFLLQIITASWTQDFPLEQTEVRLGRDRSNDCVINEAGIAAHHISLVLTGSSYEIRNLALPESLLCDGRPIQSQLLKDGDRLTLGSNVTLVFQVMPSSDTVKRLASLDLRQCDLLTIGRDPRNQTVIDHPLVSRFHARLRLYRGQWQVEDLNSSNGTFVNNQQIDQTQALRPGDQITIGPYQFSFNVDETLIQQNETGNLRLDALGLSKQVSKLKILDSVSLSILPQEFVAIVGVSGAGKSTLLNALNGFQPATEGRVCVNGQNLYKHFNAYRTALGYVPQDDIIHQTLTVRQALDFSARLRLPSDVSDQERSRQVQEVLEDLELQHRQDVPVKQLSGGQRKRVSMGVELLTKPSLFFLDEATSGLDPGTETQMMRLLRRLADQGRTIVLVTHATKNVMICDRVLFLALGGRLAFYGSPQEALNYFEVEDFDEIYLKLESESTPEQWQQQYRHSPFYQSYIHERQLDLPNVTERTTPPKRRLKALKSLRKSGVRQWWILSQRTLTLLLQDRASLLLTLCVAPLLGLLDFAMWRRDVFDPQVGDSAQSFTVLFVSVLIAVIVGSLATMREIVKEAEIYRRERMMGLQIFPYIFSKLWFCVILALYDSAVFYGTKVLSVDFLVSPLESWGLFFTLFLATLSGMVMGLLVSSLSPNQSVAPLLTILFLVPQITFAGSILPLRVLGSVGQGISQVTISRWSYESMINLSNIGESVASDACWLEPEAVRDTWGDEQKQDCTCLGASLFQQCRFPGLWKQYDPAVDQPEPIKPDEPGNPPDVPDDIQALLSGDYTERLEAYNQSVEVYQEDLDAWQQEFRQWKEDRGKAIAAAEELLQRSYRNKGQGYRLTVWHHWARLGLLNIGMLAILAWVQKRKDPF
ncbi:MAG: FHA domain-containing protein [Cyanobacteria bacterium P01_F01_bin.42]